MLIYKQNLSLVRTVSLCRIPSFTVLFSWFLASICFLQLLTRSVCWFIVVFLFSVPLCVYIYHNIYSYYYSLVMKILSKQNKNSKISENKTKPMFVPLLNSLDTCFSIVRIPYSFKFLFGFCILYFPVMHSCPLLVLGHRATFVLRILHCVCVHLHFTMFLSCIVSR